DTVVVGAACEDSGATGMNGDQTSNAAFQSGAAYVFVREGARWRQQAYLKASNTAMFDLFGSSVAAADDTVAVGAYGEASAATGVDGDQADNGAPYAGAAYVFVREETGWRQQAYLKASNTEAHDVFGVSVAAAGDTVVVGADSEDSSATGVNGNQTNNAASYAGAAYVMTGLGISPTPNATPAPPTATPIETATAIPALRVQIYIPAVWAE
ncbi:MAG TPA: FG-GAP repeat protein, partial [Herpetosiphonaceae bacterium]